MAILSAILTVFLVLDCIFLVFLILLQLPKKEAGMGVAFGGGATEALFGAGSGTVLTKITKYCAGIFMGLSLLLSVMNSHRVQGDRNALDEQLQRRAASAAPAGLAQPTLQPQPAPSGTTNLPTLLSSTNPAPANPAPAGTPVPTNTPAAPSGSAKPQ